MKTYIGIKKLEAEPATKEFPVGESGETIERNGYRVVYPDGYESWSPRDVFEEAYSEVNSDDADDIIAAMRSDLGYGIEVADERRTALRSTALGYATHPAITGPGPVNIQTMLENANRILAFLKD